MRRFFVTGSAGFIGSAFVRLALDEDPESQLVNVDALIYPKDPDNLPRVDLGS